MLLLGYGLLISWWSIIIDLIFLLLRYFISSLEVDPQSSIIISLGFFKTNFLSNEIFGPYPSRSLSGI